MNCPYEFQTSPISNKHPYAKNEHLELIAAIHLIFRLQSYRVLSIKNVGATLVVAPAIFWSAVAKRSAATALLVKGCDQSRTSPLEFRIQSDCLCRSLHLPFKVRAPVLILYGQSVNTEKIFLSLRQIGP
jgi:hypothetical protein